MKKNKSKRVRQTGDMIINNTDIGEHRLPDLEYQKQIYHLVTVLDNRSPTEQRSFTACLRSIGSSCSLWGDLLQRGRGWIINSQFLPRSPMRCITLLPGKISEEVDVSRRVTVHGVSSLGDNIRKHKDKKKKKRKHKDYECSF